MAVILLAEDDVSMCTFIKGALKKAGHVVTATNDGLSAYEALTEDSLAYDLLLTDIVMPGMDGIELSKKAAVFNNYIKIMFITGFAAMAVSQEKADERTAQVLAKPFHLNELVDKVDALLSV